MNALIKSASLVLASIILARFVLPPNITPILAVAIFLPHITENKHLRLFLPVGILLVTDLFLGFYGMTMFFVYGTMLLIGILSHTLKNRSYLGILQNSVISVLLWHLIVNFGVYLNQLGSVSLIQTYVQAIPFDFRLLLSTVFFSTLFYGALKLVHYFEASISARRFKRPFSS